MSSDPAPTEATPPAAPGGGLDWRLIRAFARFSGRYWRGATAFEAWSLTTMLVLVLFASTLATVMLNHWTRWFFDALERRDAAGLWNAVLLFPLIIGAMAAIGVGIVLSRESLQVRWRAWIVGDVVSRWLARQRYYHMGLTGTQPANPEYRIADDSRWASEPLVDLGIGLVMALFAAAAFISILWSVGGDLSFVLGGRTVAIPAYMVLGAVGYGVAGSLITMWIGRPLVGLVARKNEAEGDFRFALMRLRDNAEAVALMRGEPAERRILSGFYGSVVAGWMGIVWRHGRLTWITNAIGPMTPVVPLLLASPKYLSGELTLGQVTQLAAAFIQVQAAISWLVDNYNRIAEWLASARRVLELVEASDAIDQRAAPPAGAITLDQSRVPGLILEDVRVSDPSGRLIAIAPPIRLGAGETLVIAGGASAGKSTLVRAIAGLWQAGSGRIGLAREARVMIAPQAGYTPLATLRETLSYPQEPAIADDNAGTALIRAGLGHLVANLDKPGRWDQTLSSGERQRISIARILLHHPDIIILDDAMAALTRADQQVMIETIRTALPEAGILILGHDPPEVATSRERVSMTAP